MRLYTAQYHYSGPNRVDITTKAKHGFGAIVQPEWSWVNGYKTGKMSEGEYTRRYMEKLAFSITHYSSEWINFILQEEAVIVCFCKPRTVPTGTEFCHRYLLKDFLLKQYGQFVDYHGEKDAIHNNLYPGYR